MTLEMYFFLECLIETIMFLEIYYLCKFNFKISCARDIYSFSQHKTLNINITASNKEDVGYAQKKEEKKGF